MQKYFGKFPKLAYTKDGNTNLITNLLARVTTIQSKIDNSAIYYEYDIQEGDTPEIIASKYYGDPGYHWVVMIFNNVFDASYDWPMTYQQFQAYIIDKYGDAATAKTTIKQYLMFEESIDNYTQLSTTNTYEIDYDTYSTLVESSTTKSFSNGVTVTVNITKRAVDCYDYEEQLNESKRKIKLIKKELLGDVKQQFDILMGV